MADFYFACPPNSSAGKLKAILAGRSKTGFMEEASKLNRNWQQRSAEYAIENLAMAHGDDTLLIAQEVVARKVLAVLFPGDYDAHAMRD